MLVFGHAKIDVEMSRVSKKEFNSGIKWYYIKG